MTTIRRAATSWMGASWAAVLVGCLAGPQPEPPDDPRDASAARADDEPPGAGGFAADGGLASGRADADPTPGPTVPADGGSAAPDGGGGGTGEDGVPWLDPDQSANARDDSVAPFPFEPCCGWFVLPGADAGPDAGD